MSVVVDGLGWPVAPKGSLEPVGWQGDVSRETVPDVDVPTVESSLDASVEDPAEAELPETVDFATEDVDA